MNTQDTPINDDNADAILTAFALDLETGTATITDWTTRFPALGRDFARVAATHFAGDDAPPAPDARLRHVAMTTLQKYKTAYLGAAPLTSLIDKERGITAATLAAAIALPLPFIAKLNQRLFQAATIPQVLVQRLADAAGRTADEISAYLAQPPVLARSAAYRADDAPVVGTAEDFAAALQADTTVSPEARALYGG